MKGTNYKSGYLIGLNFLTLVLIIAAVFLCRQFEMDTTFLAWIVGAIVFFDICEITTILVVDAKRKTATAKQMVNIYMLMKVGRILLSLLLATVYAIFVKVELKRFVLVFVLLYFIYLLFDTLYLANSEKKLKKS